MTDDVEVWYFMIPVAMVFVGIAIALFFWAVKSDQFEDLDRHGSNILFDDDAGSHNRAQTKQSRAANPDTVTNNALGAVKQVATNKEQDEHSA